jgi:hypothetical protein
LEQPKQPDRSRNPSPTHLRETAATDHETYMTLPLTIDPVTKTGCTPNNPFENVLYGQLFRICRESLSNNTMI